MKEQINDAWDGRCYWCRENIGAPQFAGFVRYDHVVPVALGGKNSIDNLVIACHYCNAEKSAMTSDAWEKKRADNDLPWPPEWAEDYWLSQVYALIPEEILFATNDFWESFMVKLEALRKSRPFGFTSDVYFAVKLYAIRGWKGSGSPEYLRHIYEDETSPIEVLQRRWHDRVGRERPDDVPDEVWDSLVGYVCVPEYMYNEPRAAVLEAA